MFVVTTGSIIMVAMGTVVSKVSIGRDTVTGAGVGVGVPVPAKAAPLSSNEAVTASVTFFQFV